MQIKGNISARHQYSGVGTSLRALGCRFLPKNLQSGPRGVIDWCLARSLRAGPLRMRHTHASFLLLMLPAWIDRLLDN